MSDDEVTLCALCDGDIPDGEPIRIVGSQAACTGCSYQCHDCRTIGARDDSTLYGLYRYCSDCMGFCMGCATNRPNEYLMYVDWADEHLCEECWSYCEECDGSRPSSNLYDGVCSECRSSERERDIEGYHHTNPSMWLGGPVKNQGGYYLGIELEISSDRMVGTPVLDWAEQNLGTRGALHCKSDSSVSGFEIVTEPMTPDYFEAVDWDGFMAMLNDAYPLNSRNNEEPTEHGLHVHIGKQAFAVRKVSNGRARWVVDQPSVAAFSYLLATGNHLERIGRRAPYHYCRKVDKPVSVTVVQNNGYGRQAQRINSGRDRVYADRAAINLLNSSTVEIRAFKSTRSADELRDAVRLVYVAAEYVRFLRSQPGGFGSTKLRWDEFAAWVQVTYPYAYPSISGGTSNRIRRAESTQAIVNYSEVDPNVRRVERLEPTERQRQRAAAAAARVVRPPRPEQPERARDSRGRFVSTRTMDAGGGLRDVVYSGRPFGMDSAGVIWQIRHSIVNSGIIPCMVGAGCCWEPTDYHDWEADLLGLEQYIPGTYVNTSAEMATRFTLRDVEVASSGITFTRLSDGATSTGWYEGTITDDVSDLEF